MIGINPFGMHVMCTVTWGHLDSGVVLRLKTKERCFNSTLSWVYCVDVIHQYSTATVPNFFPHLKPLLWILFIYSQPL